MRNAASPPGWPALLRRPLSILLLAATLVSLALAIGWFVASYRATIDAAQFAAAPVCGGPSTPDCRRHIAASVVHSQPAGSMRVVTLSLQTGERRTVAFLFGADSYNPQPGTLITAEFWHGALVGLRPLDHPLRREDGTFALIPNDRTLVSPDAPALTAERERGRSWLLIALAGSLGAVAVVSLLAGRRPMRAGGRSAAAGQIHKRPTGDAATDLLVC